MVWTLDGSNSANAYSRRTRLRGLLAASLVSLSLLFALPARAGVLDRVTRFRIQPEVLRQALLDFAKQAHVQVILGRIPHRTRRAVALAGRYTGRQAIERLLRGTGLTYAVTDHTVEVFPKTSRHLHSADLGRDAPAKTHANESAARKSTAPHAKHVERTPPSLQAVVVTGTHLSGGPPPSEPIITITRRQIRESGYQSVEQLMDSLPENFNSVGSEASGSQSEVDAGNLGFGAAVDLLGLGYDSSLVLVNGHRLAPGGINGAFTDISVIPLSAIKRIDIVTDGASAIYGADAIGGVVNYILRNHEQGGETSLEYGSVTRGGLKDYRLSQSYGLNWASGHALLAYEYHDETPLNVLDRPFSTAAAPGDLTAGMTQNSVYLSAGESLSRDWRLHQEAFYSHRRNTDIATVGAQPFGYAETAQYSYALGSSVLLPRTWTLHARLSYGGNDTHVRTVYGSLAGDNNLSTASVVVNGPLWKLPAGEIKGAAGVQLRYASLSSLFTGLFIVANIDKHRTVDSAFLEAEFPLLSRMRQGGSVPEMTLDVAGRVDHYSDFGTSVNPKVGLAWHPMRGVKLRGTISSSFKAPNFYQLYGDQYSELVNSPEPQLSAGQTAAVLYLSGSNENLTAEKSTEWTLGLDLSPADVPGLRADLTYYHVRFKQRIVDPNIPLFAALDQGGKFSAFILRNPSANQLERLASPVYSYLNLTALPGLGPVRSALDAVAIADDRFQNIGQTRSGGILATAMYHGAVRGFRYNVGLNGAYILEFKNSNVPGAPSYSVLSTVGNPVNFRGRVTAGIHRATWGFSAFLNYVNRYRDVTLGTPVPVASWTTLNFTASYRLFGGVGHWGRARLYLSCINCLNRAPPAVRLTSSYLGYDPSNANALERFVSATVSVRW